MTSEVSFLADTMRFRFQIGENEFASKILPVAVCTAPFDRLSTDLASFQVPRGAFEENRVSFVVFSNPIETPLPILSRHGRYLRYASHQYRRGQIVLQGTMADYLASMPSERRSKLKRKVRRFETSFADVVLEEYSSEEELLQFHAQARKISEKTYQENLFGKGLPNSPEFLDGMRARGRATPRRARGYILRAKGQAAAFLYTTVDGGVMTAEFIGYEPEFRNYSPGNVLQYRVIERLLERNDIALFDFGEGESQYKVSFANRFHFCADVYYFPPTPMGVFLATSQAGLFVLSRSIVRAVDALGLKTRVKQWLRRQGTQASKTEPSAAVAADEGETTAVAAE